MASLASCFLHWCQQLTDYIQNVMHCRYVQHLSKRIEDLALIGIIEVITDMSECFALA